MSNHHLNDHEKIVLAQALDDYMDGIIDAFNGGAEVDVDETEKIVKAIEEKLL